MDREGLLAELETLDSSLYFIMVILGAILLNWLALRAQREEACAALEGANTSHFPSVFPLRLGGSALIIGALGFFFCLALVREGAAQAGDDPVEGRSAWLNSLASALVLAAALVRLEDLLFAEASGQQALLEEEVQPPV